MFCSLVVGGATAVDTGLLLVVPVVAEYVLIGLFVLELNLLFAFPGLGGVGSFLGGLVDLVLVLVLDPLLEVGLENGVGVFDELLVDEDVQSVLEAVTVVELRLPGSFDQLLHMLMCVFWQLHQVVLLVL